MIKIPELLMPAGGPEQLRAAAANGADAVYMSGSMFTARANARNFSDQEIAEAIEFAHLHGVKVHITQNTLIKDGEIKEALKHAVRMYELGADALILQDRGLASLIKKVIPDMPLHLSTQGTAYDASGVLSAVESGFSRVILSRELSLDEIREIKKQSPIEIETFVHGAICICYSGQCHMSDFIGGRSGNRGACAQPCRLPYELCGPDVKNRTGEYFPLSPADMNLVAHLRELAEAGVDSIKIEGRMKSPEYVAAVASVYRRYLDMIKEGPISVEKKDIDRLKQMFNRGDFTDAYLMGRSDLSLMSEDIPKHKGLRIGRVVEADRKRGHAVIRLSADLANGDGIELRKGSATCGNIITYIKETVSKGGIVKAASSGMTVRVGDLPELTASSTDFTGADVYKITDKKLMKEAADSYSKVPQRIDTEFVFSAAADDYGILTATVHDGDAIYYATAYSQIPFERAVHKAADEGSVKQRLSKTGGTPYKVTNCFVELSGGPAISAAELNNMRRTVLDDITQQRLDNGRPTDALVSAARSRISDVIKEHTISCQTADSKRQISLFFYDRYDCGERVRLFAEYFGKKVHDSLDMVMLIPVRLAEESFVKDIVSTGSKAAVYIPAITKDWSAEKIHNTADKLEMLCDKGHIIGVYAANHGHVHMLEKRRIPLYFDEGMNIYNSFTLAEGRQHGMLSGVVSHELSAEEIKMFASVADMCEVTVSGRIPLMYMEHCPIGSTSVASTPCTSEKKMHHCRKGDFVLKDRKGEEFPVFADDSCCRATLISHKPIDEVSSRNAIDPRFKKLRLYVYDEEPEDIHIEAFI